MIPKTLPLDTLMQWSNFTYLQQIPVDFNYEATDKGIKLVGKHGKLPICDPITIMSINLDRKNDNEYIEVGFTRILPDGTKKFKSIQMESYRILEKEGMKDLQDAGFNIQDRTAFARFISTVKSNINYLNMNGIETYTKRYMGSSQYGFEITDGVINYDVFVGFEDEAPITPSKEYARHDRAFCKRKGTLEEQLAFYEEFMKDSPCKTFIKKAIATALVGIVRMFLTNYEDIPKPVYFFSAPTSFGKTYLEKLIIGMFSYNESIYPIACSTGSSLPGENRLKNRFGVFTYIDDDWGQLKDVLEISERAYNHSNGGNIQKANTDGTLRQNTNSWEGGLTAFGENQDLVRGLRNGANNRVVSDDCGITEKQAKDEDLMIFGNASKKGLINSMQEKAYGHTGRLFVKKMREYYKKNGGSKITQDFIDLSSIYRKKLGCSDKIASLYALLDMSYNLAYSFGVFPESWGGLTVEDNIHSFDFEKITTTEEQLYNLYRNRILSQTTTYIDKDVKMTQALYDEKIEKGQQVRGRIEIIPEDKSPDGRRLKVAIVPTDVVDSNINELQKKYSIPLTPFASKTWLNNGWLLPTKQGNVQHSKINITRQFIKKQSKNEVCYVIILEDLTPTEEERKEEEAIAEKERQEKLLEDKNKIKIFNAKYLPNDGLMDIPSTIDPENEYTMTQEETEKLYTSLSAQ